MARPARIRLNANRKITALSTEGALDRWNPGVKAASEDAASLSIYEVIGEDPHQGNITVKVLGLAASAASIIAMAGDNIQIGASSFLMIHNAWVLAMGNKADLREVADFLEPFDRALADVYVARSGQELAAVQAAMDAETWFNGSQAVELGYANELLAADAAITEEQVPAEGDDVKAIRRAEMALCHEMPRSAARDLLNKIKGKPDAAPDTAKPDAGDPELTDILAGLLETIRA
jgi:ATP-dependent Clp protease protease subunit